ncbi:MAG: TlpA disulfide reductase family protein [Opitutaceae bacterium]|jgi:peroxiredoxin
MKTSLLLARSLAFAAGLLIASRLALPAEEAAGPAPSVTASSAEVDWQAYEKTLKVETPKPVQEMSPLEQAQFVESYYARQREAGLAFIEKYPSDPRRWKAVIAFSADNPRFVKEWGPLDEKGAPSKPVVDEDAAAAWKAKIEALRTALAKASDVPEDVREQYAGQEAIKPFGDALQAQSKGQPVDLAALRATLASDLAAAPDSKWAGTLVYEYAKIFEKVHPDKIEDEWQSLADSPSASVREQALAEVRYYGLIKKPIDIKFTAVDGREVDLAKLRGKVVLVDFWATWCQPCVNELPNVVKAYETYHDKGFEVVGISLDQEGDRQKLIDFTKSHGMPWPQYFDGKWWNNEISTRYAIQAIPAMFLLDQNGIVVSTNARGEKLEAEIKRLLSI